MLHPSLKEFEHLASGAGLVPVYREIVADLDTPLTVFAKVAGDESHAFLFESMEGGEKWGRYSFIGLDPIVTFESRGEHITIKRDGNEEELSGDPIAVLQELLASFKACDPSSSGDPDLFPRFFGGAVGFLGYDMVRFMERLPAQNPELAEFPDSAFMVPRIVLIYDSLRQVLTVVNLVRTEASVDPAAVYEQAVAEVDNIIDRLKKPLPTDYVNGSASSGEDNGHNFTSNMS